MKAEQQQDELSPLLIPHSHREGIPQGNEKPEDEDGLKPASSSSCTIN